MVGGLIVNIAIVTWAACSRCMKESIMLRNAGHRLFLFTYSKPQIENIPDVFHHVAMYDRPELLAVLLKDLDFIDIVHVHNEPSWMVNVAKGAGYKVVLDAHDLNIVRYGWDRAKELGGEDILAIGSCDGLIVPCYKYIDIIQEEATLVIPRMELLSYANEEDFTENENDLKGIVYQGSIYKPVQNHPLPYRLYHEVAKKIISMEIDFHIYPGMGYERYMEYYKSIGCKTYKALPQAKLIKELGRHSWGFVGSPIKHRQWDNTFSNKLFDYIAAGIPSIIYQAEATEKRFRLRGVGAVIDDLEDIKDYYDDKTLRNRYRDSLMEVRKRDFTMESQYDSLMAFYKEVLTSES